MAAAPLVTVWMLGDQPLQAHPALAPAERTTISREAAALLERLCAA